MSKTGFRTFAAGMILSTSVLGGTYLLSDKEQAAAKVEKEVTEADIKTYLTNNNKMAIDTDEYEEFLASKNAADQKEETKVAEQPKTEEAPKEEAKKVEEKKEEVVSYKVAIKDGMTTSEVSDALELNGIIESSKEFDKFLISNDYHTKVQLGTFEVKKGMTFAQLADVITR
ncbi:endolytic transglycosylase MltG [Metabacillus litoralis]|uniref:Endolytic transglycosylase MltG n=1 Tax=Metabacillus litoralis TaxID=152268 RepID=A0A5C6W9C3_9BACI|nr:endolytic transglycosylase MltG [Metabacillus litoralis]TXC92411.1 endolytic transglycosylase MltG [Metabacillus litoralis]